MVGTEPNSFGLDAGGWVLLGLALAGLALETLLLTQVAGKPEQGDAAFGQGIAWLFAICCWFVTWVILGVSLLRAVRAGLMHPGGGAALAIFLACGAGCGAAFVLLEEYSHPSWPAAFPVLLPLAVGLYTVALYSAPARAVLASRGPRLWCVAVFLLLSCVPCVKVGWNWHSRAVNERLRETMVDESKREENLAKLSALPASTPLWEWVELLNADSGVRSEALAAARKLDHRQADVEQMLEWEIPQALALMPELDVKGSPRLCKAANGMLMKKAEYATEQANRFPGDYSVSGHVYVEESVPALRWLAANGCDCDEANAALQAAIGHYNATKEQKAGIEALAALRRK